MDAWRAVVRPNGNVETESFDLRDLAPGEFLVETERTAISAGTELGSQEQGRQSDYYPGYSNVGHIVELGPGVSGFSVGDRILSAANHASHAIIPARSAYTVKVPDGAPSDHAAFGVIGMVAMYGARRAEVAWGEHVVISGSGMVGQLATQILAHVGAETLTAIDLSDFRLARAKESGATHTLNPQRDDVATALRDITHGRGVDVAVEASGYPDALPALFEALRVGGRCTLLGSIWHRKVTLDLMPFHEKELTLIGTHQPKCPDDSHPHTPWSRRYNGGEFLARIADGRINIARLLTHVLMASDAAHAYQLLREARDEALGVVFRFD